MVNIIIRARRDFDFSYDGLELIMMEDNPDRLRERGRIAVVTNLILEEREQGAAIPTTARTTMTQAAAQKLMDDLWNEGIRPSDYKDTREAVVAMKAHIEDLRKMAFAELELNLFRERGPGTSEPSR